MNQFTPESLIQAGSAQLIGRIFVHNTPASLSLRQLAAQFKMHHAIIHRLGPANMRLADATYSSTVRGYDVSCWTIGNLLTASTIERLLAGNTAVSWQNETIKTPPGNDPLSRADICHGISVPFHNALGNHVALTLCDSAQPKICTAELYQLALPLIDHILTTEREKNTSSICLTQREAHCLQWAAAGKTSLETGMILNLSPHTVNQYLTAATVKLGAVNRTHAVTKAVRLGLIDLSAV